MIKRIPINPLQAAIYEILSTKQTTPVYDSVPDYKTDENGDLLLDGEGNPIPVDFPYIIISDYELDLSGSKDVDICDITFELEIWTSYQGKAEVNSIMEDVTTVLTAWPMDLSTDNFNVMSQTVKGGKGTRQDDLFYGIVYFSAKIQNLGGR